MTQFGFFSNIALSRRAVALAMATLVSQSAIHAQTTSGDLAATVRDATGAVVPQAQVTATNVDTGVTYKGVTSQAGEARIANLPQGNYNVTATAPGFRDFTLNQLRIDINKTSSADLVLPGASATENISVSANAGAVIDTTSTNLTQSFETAEVTVLPIATTSVGVINLSLLSPGVASTGGVGAGVGPSVGGQRPRNNNFMIEGVDNNNKSVTGPLVYVPNDAVGEFSLITNQFSPEFGHSSGGQFNTNVKSGTNQYHGTVYEYFQNRNLNAQNVPAGQHVVNPRFDFNRYGGQVGGPIKKDKLFFFANYERQTTGQSTQYPICTPTAAGIAALSSPGLGLNQTNLAQFIKYTPVAPGQVDAAADSACFNQKSGPQFLNVYPGTNLSGAPYTGNDQGQVYGSGTPVAVPLGNYLVNAPNFINFDALTTSGDWTISPRDSLRLRYIYNRNNAQDIAATLPTFFQSSPSKYHLIALSEYHNFSPSLVNEVRVGFNRYANVTPSGNYNFPGLDQFPNLQFFDQGIGNVIYGPDQNAPQSTIQNLYQFVDNVSWTKGTHTIKVGFDGRKYISPQTFTQRARGDYEYDYLTEYLHDLAPTSFGERSTGNFTYYGDQTALYGYANDTWRVDPKLTLNYGVRYEFTSVPVGERAQALNSAASVPGLIRFSAPQPQYKNFAPRIGIDYAPNSKTNVRAGFGMAYDVLFDNLGTLSFPPQYSSTEDVGSGVSPNPGDPNFLGGGGLPAGSGSLATFATVADQRAATSAYLPDQRLPYAETWSLGVQQVFGSDYTAEVRYLGTRGIHLATQTQINIVPRVNAANQLFTELSGPTTVATSPGVSNLAGIQALSNVLPQYSAAGFTGKITSYQPSSESNYNALQTSLIRRFHNGFLLNAAYTWSKTMDDATAEVYSTVLTPRRPQNSQDIRGDYSRSALDRTNRITVAAVYDLPYFKNSRWVVKNIAGNWEISPIYTYESPEYATALSGVNSNLNGDSSIIDRPIVNLQGVKGTGSGVNAVYSTTLAGNCTGGSTQCSGNLVGYVAKNPNAEYIQAGAGTLPTARRNTLATRPIDDIDVTASKRVNITERYSVQFQAQAFNVLNHPQYTPTLINNVSANSYVSSTAFQNVTSAAFNRPEQVFRSNGRTMQLTAKFSF